MKSGISESGIKAKQLNSYYNVKTAEKNLQLRPDKCHTVTVAHKSAIIAKEDLFIDNWSKKHNE